MKTLPEAITNELNADYAFLVYLVEIAFTTGTLYFTNADMAVYDDGHKYVPFGMEFGAMEYSITPEVDKLSVEFDNTQLSVSQWVMTQEVRGKSFMLYIAVLDSNMGVIGKQLMFDGLVDTITNITKKSGRMEVFNHMIMWKQRIPKRNHSPNCAWSFKDPATCKYTGTAWTCDRSWEQCSSYLNTLNFGGFRWLPSLVDQQIWFGRKPK